MTKLSKELIQDYNQSRKVADKSPACYAPFTSLNFEQGGNITACCYNRTHILGKYPNQSINEAWTGEAAASLRLKMKQWDFSSGCELCAHQLISRNFAGARMHAYETYVAQDNWLEKTKKKLGWTENLSMPRSFEFEIDNVCNLECVMCSGKYSNLIRKNREQLPPLKSPYDDAFVDQLKAYWPHLYEAKFLGGEPFLTPLYFKMWDDIKRINPNIALTITTNGTVLNARVKQLLEDLVVFPVLSIDALDADLYEAIRQNARFEKVKSNLDYFLQYTSKHNRTLSFAVCPMTYNWQHIPDMLQYANTNGIKIFFNTVVQPLQATLKHFTATKLQKVVQLYKGVRLDGKGEVEQLNNLRFGHLINQLEEWTKEAEFNERALKYALNKVLGIDELNAEEKALSQLIIKTQHLYLFSEQLSHSEVILAHDAAIKNVSEKLRDIHLEIYFKLVFRIWNEIALSLQNAPLDSELLATIQNHILPMSLSADVVHKKFADVGFITVVGYLISHSLKDLEGELFTTF